MARGSWLVASGAKSTLSLICLFGALGSGKTRLLQELENTWSSTGVLRAGAQSMVSELCSSLSIEGMRAFRDKYPACDKLLVDNLWVLEKIPAASAEICRILRERQHSGKLTLVASDFTREDWTFRSQNIAQLLAGGTSVHLECPSTLPEFEPNQKKEGA